MRADRTAPEAVPSATPDLRRGNTVGFGDDGAFDGLGDPELLSPEESLDDDELGGDPDEGYSPPERPWGVTAWGTTAAEQAGHEDLAHRLAREEPDVGDVDFGDGIGDTSDTDGEPVDREVGAMRSGRLVLEDLDEADPRSDYFARDIGVDGAGASAEEAAMHVVADDEAADGVGGGGR
jgi:hypothetical protein